MAEAIPECLKIRYRFDPVKDEDRVKSILERDYIDRALTDDEKTEKMKKRDELIMLIQEQRRKAGYL